MTIRELISTSDPSWRQWWAIYTESFPADERENESYFKNIFDHVPRNRSKDVGFRGEEAILVLEKGPAEVVGIAVIERMSTVSCACLWYIAIRSDSRCQGYGEHLYRHCVDWVRSRKAGVMVMEVELPRERQDAIENRRIDWYRRLGAKLLSGVEYEQSTESSQISIPMALMIHLVDSVSIAEIRDRLKSVFKQRLRIISDLALV